MKKWALPILLLAGTALLINGYWIPVKALIAQQLLQRAWHQSRHTGETVRAWPWADTWPVGRLRQPRLGVDLIVLEGESGEVLAFGPGHLPGSGLPGGADHSILAGHRDTSFAFLEHLQQGDELIVEGATTRSYYQVQQTAVVPAASLYLNGEAEGLLTLITCYPFNSVIPGGELRYVVMAELRNSTI